MLLCPFLESTPRDAGYQLSSPSTGERTASLLRQVKSFVHSNHSQREADTQMVPLLPILVVKPKAEPECGGGDETLQKAKTKRPGPLAPLIQ